MNDDFDFRKDIEIDPMSLEDEWTKQPLLMYDYSEGLSNLKDELRALELKLSAKTAETAYLIRCENYDPEITAKKIKVTADMVKELLDKDTDLILIRKEVNQKRREVDQMANAVESIAQRRYGLQKLVDLYIYGYYNNINYEGSQKMMRTNTPASSSDIQQLRELNSSRKNEED